jgi:tripartite-type tricarboxylate transporter receptor subunit TctC
MNPLKTVVLILALVAAEAAAQYPAKPIKLVVPFPPGGPNDLIGRIVGQKMAEDLGQPLVLENRPGAGGALGAEAVAKSSPDGYVLLLGTTGTLAIAPGVRANLPYDPATSFAPISRLTRSVFLVVVNASVPAHSLRELIDLAKARPRQLTYAGVNATPLHIAGEMFKAAAGVDLMHVPYKGAGPAIADLVAGRTDVMFEQLPALRAHIRSGKLRPLAVASANRLALLHEVPTAGESGLPGYEVDAWSGLLAPAGTPAAITERLHAAVSKALASVDVRDALTGAGTEAAVTSPDEFARLMAADRVKWSRAAKDAGAKLE